MSKLKKNKKGQVVIPNEFDRVIIPDEFPRIEAQDLKIGDIVLFINGNRITEWHGRNRKKKLGRSTKPPYHAAIVAGILDGMPIILDPELNTTLSPMLEYTRKKKIRIDIVRFEASDEARTKIQQLIWKVASKEGFYDWKGFGAFASQMPYVGWMFKWVKPSKKDFFCSDASSYVVQESTTIRVSPRGHNFTAPLDIQIYGMKNHRLFTLKKEGELD